MLRLLYSIFVVVGIGGLSSHDVGPTYLHGCLLIGQRHSPALLICQISVLAILGGLGFSCVALLVTPSFVTGLSLVV